MSSSILLSAYSASLISHLTVALPKLPFYTVNEFYEQDSYKMAVIRQGETFDFIQVGKQIQLNYPDLSFGLKKFHIHYVIFYRSNAEYSECNPNSKVSDCLQIPSN